MHANQSEVRVASWRAASSSWWNFRAGLLIISTFFPYLGVPVGMNTNIPFSTLASLLVVHAALRMPAILLAFIIVLTAPAMLATMQVFLGPEIVNPLGLAIWPLHVMPLFGFAAIVVGGSTFPLVPLRISIGVTVVFAAVQKFYLEMGVIPFIQYYRLPGYASVEANAESITRYIRRPFAFFPEPSFMAGSLALAIVALIVLCRHLNRRLDKWEYFLAFGCVGAIYLSDSGSGLVSIGLILFTLFWPEVRGAWRITLVLAVAIVSTWLGSQVLESRGLAQNYSWSDRAASILGALRYFTSSEGNLLLGAGKGSASLLYRQAQIPLDGLQYFNALPDVFSVIARLWLECGLLFGVTLTFACLAVIVSRVRIFSDWATGIACAVLWILIAGLTISYESAAWIWAFPGIFLGFWARSGKEQRQLRICKYPEG